MLLIHFQLKLPAFLKALVFGQRPCFVFYVLALLIAGRAFAEEKDIDWEKEKQFWSFQVPRPYPKPAIKDKEWPKQPLDYFILSALEQKQLTPSSEAGSRELIRRLTFDLTGLPPTPQEVDDFLNDLNPGAYERLVERLLASPRFGERMASTWLPVARYADDQAHQVGDDTKYFYPNTYRYRDWVIRAFNTDLPYDQFIRLQLAADKFLPEGASNDAQASTLAALGFLGLGPKYYNRNRLDVMADEWEDRVDTVTRSFLGLTVACSRCHDHKFEPVTTRDYYALAGVFASTKMVNKAVGGTIEKEDISADKMSSATLHIVEDGSITNLPVFIRGNVDRKGEQVERRFLKILSPGEPRAFTDGSGRRELAEAIASPSNPLTPRVMINRIWGEFFGKPLVATPSNLGHSGMKPTHPELLDDFSARFVQNGWSIKSVIREIVLSSTYRQSSVSTPDQKQKDEPNEMLSRMNRRRLTVEQWRDAVLFVSDDLALAGANTLKLEDLGNKRRTVYSRVSRLKLNDLLMQFDYPDANVHAEKRSVTTTPMQKLFMLNSPFIIEQARALARRLQINSQSSEADKIHAAYRLLFGRKPEADEFEAALEFLKKPRQAEFTRLEQFCQVLLVSNEMLYLD